jgi:hypothetical protein
MEEIAIVTLQEAPIFLSPSALGLVLVKLNWEYPPFNNAKSKNLKWDFGVRVPNTPSP